MRQSKKKESSRGERGLAVLPVPPVSWDYLLLQSTVAQQKQREQQELHTPPSPALPTLPNKSSYIWLISSQLELHPLLFIGPVLVVQLMKIYRSWRERHTKMHTCTHLNTQAATSLRTEGHLLGRKKTKLQL